MTVKCENCGAERETKYSPAVCLECGFTARYVKPEARRIESVVEDGMKLTDKKERKHG